MKSPTFLLTLLTILLTSTLIVAETPKQDQDEPAFNGYSGFRTLTITQTRRQDRELFKGYSGYRMYNDSFQMVYYHDLTVAVIEVGDGRSLLNCELIEVFTDDQREQLLQNLKKRIGRPSLKLQFGDMINLMNQCGSLDTKDISNRIGQPLPESELGLVNVERDDSSSSQSSILSGILPGTKWCGVGDIARNYFDLGTESVMDKCCRKHDLCPVKVKANYVRYGLSNKSLYTKSHCVCDDDLAKCLQNASQPTADLMGSIYFNILRIPCITESKNGKQYRPARHF